MKASPTRAALLLALLTATQARAAGPAPAFELEPIPAPIPYGGVDSTHLGVLGGIDAGPKGEHLTLDTSYARFLWERWAPGVDLMVLGGAGVPTSATLFGSMRFLLMRTPSAAVFVMARAGRSFRFGAADAFAVGGGAGIILFPGRHLGVLVAGDVLGLVPTSACKGDDTGCFLPGFRAGVVITF